MYGHGLNYGDFSTPVAGHGGISWAGGLLMLVVVGLVIAATVIAIVLLINAARNRGVEVKGGRLVAFWFVGICLTPVMLALYVLTLKLSFHYDRRYYETAPATAGGFVGNETFNVNPTEPMSGFESPTQPLENTQVIEPSETAVEKTDL